jgi:hypothetical protein
MPNFAFAERRSHPRIPTDGLLVSVRRKGRLTRLEGMAQDFNRFGLAMIIDQPLPKDSTVFLSLTSCAAKIENIIGVVHNCTSLTHGYRCGVQFRTASELQYDQRHIEENLRALEKHFNEVTR